MSRNSFFLIGCVLVLLLVATVNAENLIINATRDGYLQNDPADVNTTWSTLRNAASGTSTGDPVGATTALGVQLSSKATPNTGYDYFQKGIITFNTSSLPDTAIISSATVNLYSDGGKINTLVSVNVSLIDAEPANPVDFVNGDYDGTTFTRQANDILYSNIPVANGSVTFTLTNTTWINKTGYTSYILTNDYDADNRDFIWASNKKAFVTFRSNAYASGTMPINLTITYTLPDTTPPASITNLANTTPSCTEINWTWTNPADADFNHTMIYWNNNFLYNVSNTTTYDLWYGLFGDYEYTFSSKTCDITGNCNTSWVNQTQTTTTCADVTPPASITNLVNNTTVCEQITWSWDNPLDADYSHLYVLKDNVWLGANLSNTTTSSTWTSLTGGVEYAFAARTVDLTGNENATWVNGTATPEECVDVTPPGTITGLYYTTPTCENISWHWTNPEDADLNHTMIYKNNVFLYNLSVPTDDDLWEGLDEGTEYTISILTVDTSGNVNPVWVNETATTDVCISPDLTADFTSNQTCVIGKPVTVQFNGTCDELTIKNHWDFGDGNTSDDIQNPNNTYVEYGVYNVTHSCKDGSDPTIYENKTDYIIVGVNGTVCGCPRCYNSSGGCSSSSGEEDLGGVMWLVFGLVGGLVVLLFLSRR